MDDSILDIFHAPHLSARGGVSNWLNLDDFTEI